MTGDGFLQDDFFGRIVTYAMIVSIFLPGVIAVGSVGWWLVRMFKGHRREPAAGGGGVTAPQLASDHPRLQRGKPQRLADRTDGFDSKD